VISEVIAMAPLLILLALATPLPSVNLASICHNATRDALPDEKSRAYDNCLSEEQAARDQVRQKWPKTSAEGRGDCAPMKGIPTSYVAILTCLDMQPGGEFDAGKQK
jgi:hypothetical protein